MVAQERQLPALKRNRSRSSRREGERPDLARHLTTVHKPRRVPVVRSQEEAARLLEAAPGLEYKAALRVAYGAGLRVSLAASKFR